MQIYPATRLTVWCCSARACATRRTRISDYDVAVFLKPLPDRWKELDRLAGLRDDFLVDTGAFFDAKPYPATAWQERTPLMREIRRDGLESMTPEAGYFLDKARKLLGEADAMLTINLNDAAGRTAYLAGFHGAPAFIYEQLAAMKARCWWQTPPILVGIWPDT